MDGSGLDHLASLARGFRKDYLDFEALSAQLRAWAAAFPEMCRLQSIGTSLEGRELWLLTLGPEPDRERPSAWVDGNMHAQELCGSSVALGIAEDVLRLHLAPESALHGLPPHVRETLQEVRFFVLPRMCPDGAEAVLKTGRYVRSNPRDRRPETGEPRWAARDVDGDGVARLMRKEDPAGEFVRCPGEPHLLVPRELEDTGPFYKVFPEGIIENFDGSRVPNPYYLADNDADLNRNFPHAWRPEPEQEGAGSYPLSEPESRAVVAFVSERPSIFAWLNLHTFGGVYIRPLGDRPDKAMAPEDLALYRQLGAWGEQHGGYPTVSGFEEFLYAPDRPLHGDLSDFAYHQRGAVALVCELHDLFRQAGIEKKKPFVDHYTHLSREDLARVARWDRAENKGRAFGAFRPFDHPQLGPVEVGGIDPRVGLVNPPYEQIDAVCGRQSAFYLRLAALAPRVTLARARVHEALGETRRVELAIENHGYLPTYVLASSRALPWNAPPRLEVSAEGCALVDPSQAQISVGHLEGWGRGLFGLSASPSYQRSKGSVSSRTVSIVVRGKGLLRLKISSPRTGTLGRVVEVE